MTRSPRFCGLVLAAGASTRMGTDKALLPWPPAGPGHPASSRGQTFLSAAIQSLEPFSEMVIVVAGENEARLAPIVYGQGASLVRNPEPERGQFSSLQIGLREVLNRGRDAALITLVDRPPVQPSTIQALCDAFAAAPLHTWAVIPEYSGHHGHPIAAAREMMEAFLKAAAPATAREVEHAHQSHIQYLSIDDASLALNVNTPEDYASLRL